MDWVPCFRWGVEQSVSPATQGDLALMDPALYSNTEVEGQIDDRVNRYFVERIVGQLCFSWSDTPSGGELGLVRSVIWPGIITNTQTGAFDTPGFIDDPSGVNARLWHIRHLFTTGTTRFGQLGSTSHPWWTTIDIRPRQVIDDGQLPILSVFNNDAGIADLEFTHYLRMLVKPLE